MAQVELKFKAAVLYEYQLSNHGVKSSLRLLLTSTVKGTPTS